MILHDLLKTLTKDDYLQIGSIHKEWVSFLQPNVSAERIAHTMQEFGDVLAGLPVEPSEYILLALPTFENGTPETHAELFLKDALREKRDTITEKDMPQYKKTNGKDVFSEIIQDTANYLPNSYGYEFCPWEMVLGATVLPENFDQSELGKIPFVASALFNMSFNGTSVEAQKKAREDLHVSLDEIEKLSEEERISNSCSWDDLRLELGIYRPEEEREESNRLVLLDSVRTYEQWLLEMKRICSLGVV